eukprot:12646395-Heterocapsa_arctica.AAC.2
MINVLVYRNLSQVWYITHIPNDEEDLMRPSSSLGRVPYLFVIPDALKVLDPSKKEVHKMRNEMFNQGSHICMARGSKETLIVTLRIATSKRALQHLSAFQVLISGFELPSYPSAETTFRTVYRR